MKRCVFILNNNWRNRPTTIDFIPNDVKWIVGIDESGNPNLKQVEKALKNKKPANDSERHFVVTACMLDVNEFENCRDAVMEVKHKYWQDALHDYKGKKKRICFHSSEIRGRKYGFSPNIIEYNDFMEDLSECLSNLPLKIFSSHINKERHVRKYKYPEHPYNLCVKFILERILRNISEDEKCVIVLESRGKKEDNLLLNQIKELIDNRAYYESTTSSFKKISGVYFNPKWSKGELELKSYWVLELADLYAYPIYKYLAHGKEDKSFEVLKPKIYGYPNIKGYGLKSFP